MKRRDFLKWLGIAPVLGFLGIKIPWPKPASDVMSMDLMKKAHSRYYDDTIILDQSRNAVKIIGKIYNGNPWGGGGKLVFNSKDYGVIACETYKS